MNDFRERLVRATEERDFEALLQVVREAVESLDSTTAEFKQLQVLCEDYFASKKDL
jgi:hypothetical protein